MSLNLIILNIILFFLYLYISVLFANKIGLIDHPSDEKKHSKPTPAIGGLVFFLIYISIYIQILLNQELGNFYHYLTIFSFLIFLIGYFDDIKNSNPYFKSLLFILIILIFLFLNEEIVLKRITISFLNSTYELNNYFKYIFTILCFWLLMNSFNLVDGLNGIAISYALTLFISFFLLFNLNNIDYFIILNFILTLCLCLIFNIRNKIFLGNNGAYLISFFLSVFLIKFYNQNLSTSKIEADRIFLMLMVPGLDMLRLFIFRSINKNNPFKRDQNHLHHYLIKNFLPKKVFIIYTLIISIPIILDSLIQDITIFLIITQIFFYFIMIKNLKIN